MLAAAAMDAHESHVPVPQRLIRFHHGTDLASANDLLQNGVNQQHAAAWNGSGEFWATTEQRRAQWFALSHPASPPAACFEFDVPEAVLVAILQMAPVAAIRHAPHDYEFLPASYPMLNHGMQNKQITALFRKTPVADMHREPSLTIWKITCRSGEEAKALEMWLSSQIDLNRTIVDTIRTAPNGVEKVEAVPHRLGDYFAAIHVSPGCSDDPTCLRLSFERRADAGRFWKDLMVHILQEIESSPQKPTINLDSKQQPGEALAGK
ncbi:MAG TPA: hypothetical protein VJ783_13230 [Pirellulales bacterium]|nr:hypothetical protein [Pirellulales bacterium]